MNASSGLRLLVLADLHYRSETDAGPGQARRRCGLGLELLRRAVEDARRRGGFDAVALMGDLVDDGSAPGAEADLAALRAELEAAAPATPVLVVPGNHDGPAGRLLEAFDQRVAVRQIGSCRFVTFADEYDAGDNCTRRDADRALLADLANRPGGPIVALQHNPISPAVEADYPYMHTNRQAIMGDYAAAAVLLALSGHYHAGGQLNAVDGVSYLTVPALCEAPFHYALVTIRGRDLDVDLRTLACDAELGLFDCHAHTQFAYCAKDVTAETTISRSRTMGLAGVCLVEHAPQLYCTADDFWQARHVRQPELWRRGRDGRMGQFRQTVGPWRTGDVRIGLEVELDADGSLTLLDEDRQWADLIVGAVHWLAEDEGGLDDAALAAAFMRTNEAILAAGVDVLAHPFRLFHWADRPVPTRLYRPLAAALAATGTAAEINFHSNKPAPEFFAECVARGVKIATGTDAHWLYEAGGLAAHLAMLRQIAGTDRLGDLLMPWPG